MSIDYIETPSYTALDRYKERGPLCQVCHTIPAVYEFSASLQKEGGFAEVEMVHRVCLNCGEMIWIELENAIRKVAQ